MKLFWVSTFLFCSAAIAQVTQVKEKDLPKLIETKNNHAIGAKEQVEAANRLTGHLNRSFLPEVDLKAGIENFKTGAFDPETQHFGGIEAKINVFKSGQDRLEEQIRTEQLLSAEAKASQVFREELKKARKTYWTLLFHKEQLLLLENALKENEKNLSAALTRIRAGSATDTDRLEFEMYRVELTQDLARTKLSIESLKRELATLLGIDPQSFETPSIVDHDHDDKILTATLNVSEHPEVSAVTSQATIAHLKHLQARRTWFPKVDLFANQHLYTFREREYLEQSNRWETVFGIQLTMDLFDGGNTFAQSASLAAETSGLQKQAAQTRSELLNQFETAKAELKLTHQFVHESEETLQRNSRYFSRSMDEYRRGVKNSLDILNVSQRSLTVRKRAAEIRRDYQLARADLLAALGQ